MVSEIGSETVFKFEGQNIVFEKKRIAKQADQAFVVRWNQNTLLSTLCVGKFPTKSNFVPLTVEFQDNLFSVNKIPGGFFRREGKPSEYSTLSARIVDRAVRHLFPKDFRHEVQIIVNPLSIDHTLDIRVVAVLSASLLLNTSELPIDHLFAGVSVGYIDGEFIFNPSYKQLQKSELEMFLVAGKKEISMIEVKASELPESKILEAIQFGHNKIVNLIKIQEQFLKDMLITKKSYESEKTQELEGKIWELFSDQIENWIKSPNQDKPELLEVLEKRVFEQLKVKMEAEGNNDFEDETALENSVLTSLSKILQEKVREKTVKTRKRIDGRSFSEVRKISCKIDYLPIIHGSAVFSRGETQTLSTVTLETMESQKKVDDLTTDSTNCFMHHYKSLPFSMGTVQRLRGLSRREIGHGFLGEKALKTVLPESSNFPYTIRVASEVLASNGSTSQAAICSASLALMAAGVPIKGAVAGIAIGLIKEGDEYHLLSDIQSWEDFYGDMDFKVAGTEKGVCSIQLDLKIKGLPVEVIDKVLLQGKKDRLKVLEIMNKVIPVARQNLAEKAMKFIKMKLEKDEITALIGPGGKNIKEMILKHSQESEPVINIQNNNEVLVYHQNQEVLNLIKKEILGSVKPIEVDEILFGVVDGITEYGGFVKLEGKNKSGLIHISNLSNKFVRNVKEILKEGQRVKVKVISLEKNKVGLKLIQ